MNKFLIRLSVCSFFFMIYFSIINLLFLGIIVYTDFDFRKRLETLKFENPNFELLVLGKSLALDGIDTELLTSNGIKSYNLALGGSSLRSNYVQLDEYLKKCGTRPKYVLLGLATYMGISDGDDIHPVVEFTMNNHKYNIHDLPLIKFQWLGAEFAKKIVSKSHRNAKLSYGQLKFQRITPDYTNYNNSRLELKHFEDSKYIGEITKICSQNGIELIILEMPGFKNTQNSSEVGPYLLNLKNGHSVYLYNFNSKQFGEIFTSDKDWIANSHLNESGATKFTKELIKFLKFQKCKQAL
jgi:hypothetical protein